MSGPFTTLSTEVTSANTGSGSQVTESVTQTQSGFSALTSDYPEMEITQKNTLSLGIQTGGVDPSFHN